MSKQPEALRLADACDTLTNLGMLVPGLDTVECAAELRRLHAQRDALLEALAWIDRRCPAVFLLQDLHKVHMEAAFDAGVCARAAIKAVEENT